MEDKKRQQNQVIKEKHQLMAQKAEMASKRMEASDPAVAMTMTMIMWGPTVVVIS